MVEKLGELIDDFPGAANQTCCFLHILNLVVKRILKQFDLPKSKEKKKEGDNDDDDGNDDDEIINQAVEELLKLASDVDKEGELMASDEEEDDNDEGWIDECEEMTKAEIKELSASIAPVRLLLTKVNLPNKLLFYFTDFLSSQLRKLAYAIKNSTTILLPHLFSVLRDLDRPENMMPCDVTTRWNSTFDMLDFAIDHITAINFITADRNMNLRKYELSEEDWSIARQLRDVLKVFFFLLLILYLPMKLC